ncbi:MAG: biotin/lipoyl-binding protein, partial [Planctomycetota bacterium]|nr:biotin/lipoyl-binding protein [Planctomycetota bacterium]
MSAFTVPWSRRVRSLTRTLVPGVVWLGAVLLLVNLAGRRTAIPILRGVAEELRYTVSAETRGRIQRVAVVANQAVEPGQVVAVLDDRDLLLKLTTARNELERLRAELDRAGAVEVRRGIERRVQTDADLRRFARDIEQSHIDTLEAKAQQGEDRIKLQGLELRLERSKGLATSQLARGARLDDDRTARNALKARIEERRAVIAEMQIRLESAKKRYASYVNEARAPDAQTVSPVLLRPLEHAIKAQEARLARIDHEIRQLALRAPTRGVVAQVLMRDGEVVRAGDPIVEVVEPLPGTVVAWIPEEQPIVVVAGQRVVLSRSTGPTIETRVARVGRRVVPLPRRMLTDLGRP